MSKDGKKSFEILIYMLILAINLSNAFQLFKSIAFVWFTTRGWHFIDTSQNRTIILIILISDKMNFHNVKLKGKRKKYDQPLGFPNIPIESLRFTNS